MHDAFDRPQSLLLLGGTSEIGLAVVRELAPTLRRVVLAGRDPAALDAAAATLELPGAEVVTVAFDAAADPAAGVAAGFGATGDVDLVVMAVGVLEGAATADPEVVGSMVTANFTGPAVALAEAGRRMRAQGHGTIVVLSSVAAERPRRSNYLYGSTKAGLDAFARGLREDLHPDAVRVVVVRPGFVRTRMTAGMAEPPLSVDAADVARIVARALATGRDEVWVPPLMRWVMAVLRHLPQPVFRRLPI